jgi:NAD-dependent dihydropyrimidine dehydrogenase PreA subunit
MKTEITHPVSSRFTSVEIDGAVCTGCNTCVDICVMDVLAPNPEKGKPPIVAYPEECWFDGCCVDLCPQRHKGAIRVKTPLPMKVSVLRGERTGPVSQDHAETEER